MTNPKGVNLDAAALMLDCDNLSGPAYLAGKLRHVDGRPFTTEEHQMVGQSNVATWQAVADYSARAVEFARRRADAARELAALTQPYGDRFGPDTTLADVRALMPADQRPRFDELVVQAELAAPRDVNPPPAPS